MGRSREEEVVKNTVTPSTVRSLGKAFKMLGIKTGDLLLVHSSLSSLGWVCGREQAVIEALELAVGEDGTIVMPSHSGDWSNPAEWRNPPVPAGWVDVIYDNMPAFDPRITPTRGMGRIAGAFWTYPGVRRSGHPHTSFSAWGRLAGEVVSEHRLSPQFGMESPLGRMYAMGARVLLLGVGYDSCTGFHLAEALSEACPMQKAGAAIMENGERIWKWFEDYAYDSDDFAKLGAEFEEKTGSVSRGFAGNADCRLFGLKTGVDFAFKWLKNNRKIRDI
ncbi:MAG: AAC(3) family N-acetyltransferase [Clostridia bacterium]|nr:AAC(3) family N-acetyltransferase [Clostridia bacterium]